MLKVKIKGTEVEYAVDFSISNKSVGTVNGKSFVFDIVHETKNRFHVLYNNKSYNAELIDYKSDSKLVILSINGLHYEFETKDKFDLLLKEMGLESTTTKIIKQIKAPMPGLVLEILVEENATVKQGDPILVLEAMKMENSIKSPVDGIIKAIHVKTSIAVEKNQLLISFL